MSRRDTRLPARRRRTLGAVVAGAAALVLGGCAQDAPQDTWQPAGDNAQKIHDLQWPVFLVAGVIGVIVLAVVAFAVVRFRDRGQPMPEQSHGKPALEIALTILPALILVGVGIPTVSTVFDLAEEADTECIINVTGQQWWWEYDYPVQDGCGGISAPIVTSGQLVIPADTNVLLRLTSRDVIHSFWIPKLNGKKDTVPGRVHTLRMQADEPGIYAGQCTEFCGLSHANMKMEAVALFPADFQTWVANQLEDYQAPAEGSLAAEGEATFTANCAYCHQVNGLTTTAPDGSVTPVLANPDEFVVSGAAPNLTNLMTRNTFAGATWDLLTEECRDRVWNAPPEEFGERYLAGVSADCLNEVDLREWIRNAPAKKPMYATADQAANSGGKFRGMPALGLNESQIDQIIAYLLERH
ncbi:MAG: cytochrome c oxidase subunit II [Acidimicrobiales bacterium]|nr:cytochrome c oxidase subunit II [Acidimicrobiales bacterium]MCB9393656.1 cytochrome c oxidase subunit II [Acidimicrobiaceae bacterium]